MIERATSRWTMLEIAALSAVLLPIARVSVRRAPLGRVRARLRTWLPSRRGVARLDASEIGRLVAAIGRRMPGIGTCLTHALVAEALLHRERHPARFVIGVERVGSADLRAHAWVESAGRIVVGAARDLSRFAPLSSGRAHSTRSLRARGSEAITPRVVRSDPHPN